MGPHFRDFSHEFKLKCGYACIVSILFIFKLFFIIYGYMFIYFFLFKNTFYQNTYLDKIRTKR
jgi:hypothetical protein